MNKRKGQVLSKMAAKSILYSKSHLNEKSCNNIIEELKEQGYKCKKESKVVEDGVKYYKIRVYF